MLLADESVLISSEVSMPPPAWDRPTDGGSINGLPYAVWIDFQRTAALEVVKYQNEKSDVHWSYGQTAGELVLQTHRNEPKAEVLMVGLYNCLPIPGENTSIESILRFKEKRSAELASFRLAMDDIRGDLLRNENTSFAFANARDKIAKSVDDVNRVISEEKWRTRMSSLESFVSLLPPRVPPCCLER
jgi:hypothetical protein